MSQSNRQHSQLRDLCPTCHQPKPNQPKAQKSTNLPKAKAGADPIVKTEPTDEERNGTKLTIDGNTFTIRARCFDVDLKFGSVQADSNGQPVRLDLLECDGNKRWAFRLKGANRGVDVLVWENDLDDVILAASTDLQIVSLVMVPVVQYAKKLSEQLAGDRIMEEAVDLRSPVEGAGKILVDVSRCHMDLKKTFQAQFNGHFKKPVLGQQMVPAPKPAAKFVKSFSCDYLGTETFLKTDLSFRLSKSQMTINKPYYQRKNTCGLNVTFDPTQLTSFKLDPTSRVLLLTSGAEFAATVSECLSRTFGPSLEVSSDAPASSLRFLFRAGQDIDKIAEFLMSLKYKVQYVPANFLNKTFPELKKAKPTDSADTSTGKRASLPGSSQGPAKKK